MFFGVFVKTVSPEERQAAVEMGESGPGKVEYQVAFTRVGREVAAMSGMDVDRCGLLRVLEPLVRYGGEKNCTGDSGPPGPGGNQDQGEAQAEFQ